jgi:hypothetical protein
MKRTKAIRELGRPQDGECGVSSAQVLRRDAGGVRQLNEDPSRQRGLKI